MKKRHLVILAFFVFLYIGPVNLLQSSTLPAIVQEPQEAKDFLVATDVSAVIAADTDDMFWEYTSGPWVNRWGYDYMYFLNHSAPLLGWPCYRWQLNVPSGVTIDDANVTVYYTKDRQLAYGEIWLIDEDNVGDLEADATKPIVDTTENATALVPDGPDGHWETSSITNLVQNFIDRAGYSQNNYMGLMYQMNSTAASSSENRHEDYENVGTHNVAYINVSYTEGAPENNEPYTSGIPVCSNPDDTDNLYAELREYEIVVNVTDEDGFTDIEYVELSLWSNTRTTEYWRLRFTEDTATFSEQFDTSNMITLGTGANISSGNNLNITFDITVHWNHTDTTDVDAKVYVRDDETQVQYFADDCKYFSVSPKQFPHAYYYNYRTYVVWHGVGELEDAAGNPFIRYYDHGSGYWSDAVQIGTNLLVDDFHGSPLVWVDSSGYIHAFFGTHGTLTPMQHAKSNVSESIEDGFTIISNLDWNVTYPVVDYVDGVIHFIYRYYDGVDQFSWVYVNSTDDGATWNTKHTFIAADTGNGTYPYRFGAAGLDPNSANRLIMAWCIRNETEGPPEMYEDVYYAYLDLVSLHVYNAAGTDLGTSIDESEMRAYCLILDTNDYGSYVGSVHTDSNAIPYIIFTSEYNDGSGHTYFTYWNSSGSSWVTPEIICNTNRWSSIGDFIVHSSSNITAFVTKTEDLHRYTWDGSTWTDAETILVATDSKDVTFSFVNAPYGDTPQDEFQITFCEWYNGYSNKAWGWGSSGILNDTSDDLGWHEVNWDFETRLDFSSFSLSDGSGTVDRGDYDTISGITASGTVIYYTGTLNPDSGDVDVWILCADIAGSPWSDLTLSAGAFSVTVDSDEEVGLDTYNFRVVEEGHGSGGGNLLHSPNHQDTYIADRLVVDIQANDTTPDNGVQVNFTLTVIYDYDDTVCNTYQLNITRDAIGWYVFTDSNVSLFNDTNSDVAYLYTVGDLISESTHGLTNFTSNGETVTWSAAATTTTTTTTTPTTTPPPDEEGFFYQLFLGLNMWGYLGPLGLVIVGYFVAKKDVFLGVLYFVVECLFVAQYLALVGVTPNYWWHITILLLGGLFTCIYPLLNRRM